MLPTLVLAPSTNSGSLTDPATGLCPRGDDGFILDGIQPIVFIPNIRLHSSYAKLLLLVVLLTTHSIRCDSHQVPLVP